ncbi:MAG: PQQ-binding-like beta-propeller repeat protein [Acidimicrobiia bacterium]|nr:PQQ-binding-like beta-propeller repeat protein [Acidimicrobiia bacterium]
MGKRCRSAAWGATFALLVAACAASDDSSQSTGVTARPTPTTRASAPTQIVFPESLADASFVQVEPPDGQCAAGDNARIALFDSNTGERDWSFPIPRPGGVSVLDDSVAYISFRWDRGQFPGIASIDIDQRTPKWQRFLTSEPEQMAMSESGLIVVTRDEVRSIDVATGEDLWVNNSEFDFGSVVVGTEFAFAIDRVGVHAIDLETGLEVWELEIENPDAVAADDSTLAVSAGPRLIAVDIANRSRLWDISVNRTGAGTLWVTPSAVSVEMSPNAAPGGGVITLDRTSGLELWRATNIGEPFWTDNNHLVSSTANDEETPAQPFVLFGLDAQTGVEQWRVPATAQAFSSVIGVSKNRVVTSDPHPAISGLYRIRLIDSTTGDVVWETTSDTAFDGAAVGSGVFVSVYRSTNSLSSDRGTVSMLLGADSAWTAGLPDGIAEPPRLTPDGLLVISGEAAPVCIGRKVGEPSLTAVLGASTQPS